MNRKLVSALLMLTLGLSACGPATPIPPTPIIEPEPPAPADFTLNLSSSAPTLQAGKTVSMTANIVRSGDFSGNVTLSLQNPPAGLSLAPVIIPAGVSSVQVMVSASAATLTGQHNLTFAADSGILHKTAGVTLGITTAPVPIEQATLTLTSTPSSLTVQVGEKVDFTVGVLRNKFSGPVTLHAVNLPAGVSVADVTVAGGQTSATLTLNTTSSSVAQVSNIQLEGVSGGVNTALNIPLTVQSSVPLPTAPTVLSTTPASSAQDVNSASLTVGVTFSQEMKTDVSKAILFTPSVTNGFCAFQDDGAPQSKVLCTGKFKPNTTYTVTVGTGAKSAAGLPLSQPYSFSFQTAPVIVPPLVDTTAPTLVSHTPSSNAVDVSTTAGVVLNFSEPMNPAETYVSIPPVLHLIKEWSNANTTLTLYVENDINPGKHSNFEWEHLYTVSVTGQDVVGNVLSGVKSFAFTTPKPPDVTRPSISNLLTYPNDGATGLPTSQEVFVQFSEPMNQAVTQVAFNFLTPPIPAANLTFTWNAQGTTLKVKPKTPFAHGQSVVWNVSSGAQDLAGNLLENASAALRGFTVLKGK